MKFSAPVLRLGNYSDAAGDRNLLPSDRNVRDDYFAAALSGGDGAEESSRAASDD